MYQTIVKHFPLTALILLTFIAIGTWSYALTYEPDVEAIYWEEVEKQGQTPHRPSGTPSAVSYVPYEPGNTVEYYIVHADDKLAALTACRFQGLDGMAPGTILPPTVLENFRSKMIIQHGWCTAA